MHAIQPNTLYALVTLKVAIPLHKGDDPESTAADCINIFLNDHLMDHDFMNDEGVFADWAIKSIEVTQTGDEVEEGQLFHVSET